MAGATLAAPEAAQGVAGPRLEISSVVTPPASLANGLPPASRVSVTNWSAPPGQTGVGMSVSVLSFNAQGLDPRPTSGVDIGVGMRTPLDGNRTIDISAWRRVSPAPDALSLIDQTRTPTYGTRVEMQFGSGRRNTFMPEFGAIGLQLDSGARIVLRSKGGHPVFYYRSKF